MRLKRLETIRDLVASISGGLVVMPSSIDEILIAAIIRL
jgi:hypothetical protein